LAPSDIYEGVISEDVATAANGTYQQRGYETGYRTLHSKGIWYFEAPELKVGYKVFFKAKMTFSVDGEIPIDRKLGGRIGIQLSSWKLVLNT
jgi:hypothetical protein